MKAKEKHLDHTFVPIGHTTVRAFAKDDNFVGKPEKEGLAYSPAACDPYADLRCYNYVHAISGF